MALKVLRKPGRDTWYLRGTINGKRYDESTGTTDLKIADAYRVKREHEIYHEAIHGKAMSATFRQAVAHYVEHGGSRRFLEPVLLHFGATQLAAIRQASIDAAA
ncbi:MAG: site-specific integrase, partial [Tabrizicola sp.]